MSISVTMTSVNVFDCCQLPTKDAQQLSGTTRIFHHSVAAGQSAGQSSIYYAHCSVQLGVQFSLKCSVQCSVQYGVQYCLQSVV